VFNDTQREQLLKPLNPSRVLQRQGGGKALSYLSQQDVRAHAIRMFGFGGFDAKTLHATVVACDKPEGERNWQASVMVTMEVVIRDEDGNACVYSETAIGSANLPQRGEALDMAAKTASSDAFKRCLINLGDQFGLSLYNNGQTAPLVKGTLTDSLPHGGATSEEETA
jgi:recombination DNA repair RAD52 pathway protein